MQLLDYFPYGSVRIDEKAGAFSQKRQYIGQEYDADTGLNYLNARYYNGNRGQFISQDSMFWALPQELLLDPQQQNSYSYARNNPITNSDPSGLLVSEFQPYLPSGKDYTTYESIGEYRGVSILSHGAYTPKEAPDPLQCVDFAKDFARAQFGIEMNHTGNAVAYGNQDAINTSMKNNKNSGMLTVYKNNGSIMPQENDLISWSNSGNGHVGVIAEVAFDSKSGRGTVYTLEQNFRRGQGLFSQPLIRNKDGTFTIETRPGYTVQGWTRYGIQSTAPTYSTTQETPAPKVPIKNK